MKRLTVTITGTLGEDDVWHEEPDTIRSYLVQDARRYGIDVLAVRVEVTE